VAYVADRLSRVLRELDRVDCCLKDDTYLQCLATQLAKFLHSIDDPWDRFDGTRQRFVENSGLKFFIERSIPSASNDVEETSHQPSKKSDFAFLVMEKICQEVKAVLSYFSPALLKTSSNRMESSSSPESERLTTEASAPAMNFLAKACQLHNEWDEIIWRVWMEGSDDNWIQRDLFFNQSFLNLAVCLINKASSDSARYRDMLTQVFHRAASHAQGPSSVANDIFCTVLLQKDPIVPIDGPHFRNLLRAHDEGGGGGGGLTLKSRTVLTFRVGLPVSPLLQHHYECREVMTAQQLREWMCSAEIASDHVSPSVLGQWLAVNPTSRHAVTHLRALARFKRNTKAVDTALENFILSIRADYMEGFQLGLLSSALSTMSQIPHPITPAQFELMAEVASMKTMPLECRVAAMEVVAQRKIQLGESGVPLVGLEVIIGKLGSVPMGCNTDWRLKDLTMTVLLEAVGHDDRKKTGKLYSSLESMTWMANFVRTMLEDTTSFVRAGALDLLAKLSSIYPYVIDQHIAGCSGKGEDYLFAKMSWVMSSDSEAIVRRSLVKLLVAGLKWSQAEPGAPDSLGLSNTQVRSLLQMASKDLDWEVREIALQYWEIKLDEILAKSTSEQATLDEFVLELKHSSVADSIALTPDDADDKRVSNKKYLLHKKLGVHLVEKFNSQPDFCRKYVVQKELSKIHGKWNCEKTVELLVSILGDDDYKDKIGELDEYIEIQQGIMTVMEDIMQSQSEFNQIDLIDCF